MSITDLPDVLTVEEAAAVLRIGRNAAYDLARQWRMTRGREGLPNVVLGRSLRVPPRRWSAFSPSHRHPTRLRGSGWSTMNTTQRAGRTVAVPDLTQGNGTDQPAARGSASSLILLDQSTEFRRRMGPTVWTVLEQLALSAEQTADGDLVASTNVRRLAGELGLAKDTVHRAMRRVIGLGFATRDSRRQAGRYSGAAYVLDRFAFRDAGVLLQPDPSRSGSCDTASGPARIEEDRTMSHEPGHGAARPPKRLPSPDDRQPSLFNLLSAPVPPSPEPPLHPTPPRTHLLPPPPRTLTQPPDLTHSRPATELTHLHLGCGAPLSTLRAT